MLISTPYQIANLIGADSIAPTAEAHSEVRSPATGELVATVAKADANGADAAVQAAHKAFQSWSKLSPYDREKIIRKATAHVRTKADYLGLLMALEQGKPLAQSVGEITSSCDTIDYYAAEGCRLEGYTNPTEKGDLRSTVIYQPVGVCALITPWNYPVSLLSWKLGPAFASGCTVVVKPTSVTPLSPTEFCRALVEGGLPAGVVNVVNGSGSLLGEALLRHPLVKKVAMTGSSATGKRLMEVFGPSLNKISLELGGHCPAIVCADADLDIAAEVISYKGFRNQGQSCSSVNRVYAHECIHDALVAKLKEKALKLSIGDGITNPKVDLGPMATAGGVQTAQEHVDDAVSKGATLVCGGKKPEGEAFAKGNYYLPTILTNCNHSMKVMREETFAAVVPFAKFKSIEEAVQLANDTEYGLVAYLFTKDYKTTVEVSEVLEAGTVCVNHGSVNTNYAPYCGWKNSGYGTELSRRAMLEYVKTKHIKTKTT